MAVGIALASDVLASAVSAYTYGKHNNLDIRNGIVMMIFVLLFTLVGSYVSALVPGTAMGGFSTFMTLLQYGTNESQKKTSAVHDLRCDGWLYLRLYRSRRRNDDAVDSDQCSRL